MSKYDDYVRADLGLPRESYPYQTRIEAAKAWLGSRYLLAKPVNQPKGNSHVS